jgi:hypothetical protein
MMAGTQIRNATVSYAAVVAILPGGTARTEMAAGSRLGSEQSLASPGGS